VVRVVRGYVAHVIGDHDHMGYKIMTTDGVQYVSQTKFLAVEL